MPTTDLAIYGKARFRRPVQKGNITMLKGKPVLQLTVLDLPTPYISTRAGKSRRASAAEDRMLNT